MLTVLVYITLFLLIGYAALIIYYRQSWLGIHEHRSLTSDIIPTTKITVIIPARNEEENINACLNSIAKQSYPKNLFDIIVVDDFSTDKTADIVRSFSDVRLISLNNFVTEKINSYKKKAIEIAIQQSSGDLIVTTDADCIVPPNWLQTIAVFYEKEQAAFIAMPVLITSSNTFIEMFQSLDFMTLQGITGASVNKKFHSMCNGANLAYTRQAFGEVDGFKNIDTIASGDDMLLMHKIAERHPDKVKFLKSHDVIVQTKPVSSVKEFFNQRIRWASKADKYNDKSILPVLMLVYFLNVMLLILPVIALFNSSTLSIINYQLSIIRVWLLLLALKTLVELFFLFPVATFFNRTNLLWWFPVAQPFHIVYTVIAGWLGKFGSYQWKERQVK
ncbi:glycosyltransferase [Ferruginibacter lapsinanis]|uniref:glycosyltransferase family 2 protein n=1 Tax=Ferruginibacter lapsinanis TaxID=563172 RepID=UPI001E539DAE|nr:glycosyltransferase [Ferruginibacter lapsinanis]UEG50675.1 glycosyltransferase [Ferruginibacter lapsinanis]